MLRGSLRVSIGSGITLICIADGVDLLSKTSHSREMLSLLYRLSHSAWTGAIWAWEYLQGSGAAPRLRIRPNTDLNRLSKARLPSLIQRFLTAFMMSLPLQLTILLFNNLLVESLEVVAEVLAGQPDCCLVHNVNSKPWADRMLFWFSLRFDNWSLVLRIYFKSFRILFLFSHF